MKIFYLNITSIPVQGLSLAMNVPLVQHKVTTMNLNTIIDKVEEIFNKQHELNRQIANVNNKMICINNTNQLDKAITNYLMELQTKASKQSNAVLYPHYFKDVSHLSEVDVYRVCQLFGVNDASGAKHHAIKKLLVSGNRGAKDNLQDVIEARNTLNRLITLMEEDANETH